MTKLNKVFSDSFQNHKGCDLVIFIDENENCEVLTIKSRIKTYEILDNLESRKLNYVWEELE